MTLTAPTDQAESSRTVPLLSSFGGLVLGGALLVFWLTRTLGVFGLWVGLGAAGVGYLGWVVAVVSTAGTAKVDAEQGATTTTGREVVTTDGQSPVISELWRGQKRSAFGCGLFAFFLFIAAATVAFLFAPTWVFVTVLILLGLFAGAVGLSSLRQLRQADFFLHESSGQWQTGPPTRRSIEEVASVWEELMGRHADLRRTTILAIARASGDPRAPGGAIAALEEHGDAEPGYWASVEILNHYQAELRNLRTLLRSIMPTVPPEGEILESAERWLSSLIEEGQQLRTEFVTDSVSPFFESLEQLVQGHQPPDTIDEAVRRLW